MVILLSFSQLALCLPASVRGILMLDPRSASPLFSVVSKPKGTP